MKISYDVSKNMITNITTQNKKQEIFLLQQVFYCTNFQLSELARMLFSWKVREADLCSLPKPTLPLSTPQVGWSPLFVIFFQRIYISKLILVLLQHVMLLQFH